MRSLGYGGCGCRDAHHERPGWASGDRLRGDHSATQSEDPGGAVGPGRDRSSDTRVIISAHQTGKSPRITHVSGAMRGCGPWVRSAGDPPDLVNPGGGCMGGLIGGTMRKSRGRSARGRGTSMLELRLLGPVRRSGLDGTPARRAQAASPLPRAKQIFLSLSLLTTAPGSRRPKRATRPAWAADVRATNRDLGPCLAGHRSRTG